jgi:cell division protein FtsB
VSRAAKTPRAGSSRLLAGAVLLFLLLLLAAAGARGGRDLAAARAREALLEQRIAATEERVAALRQRIQRLRDDPLTLERLAREELGMVRPGDVVIVLPPEPDAQGAPPQDPPPRP